MGLGKHHFLAPSASRSWLNCANAAHLSAVFKSETSEAAEEGTAAHELAAKCASENLDPASFKGEILRTAEGYEFEVTDEMIEAINLYVICIRDDEEELGKKALIEKRFDLGYTGGTADAVVFNASVVSVTDFKYGAREEVDAEDNAQLKIYALGVVKNLFKINVPSNLEIRLRIVQPRFFKDQKVKEWSTTWGDLSFWEDFVLIPAVEAAEEGGSFNPGEVQCKYCGGSKAGVCPAITSRAVAVLPPDDMPEALALKSAEEMSPEELAFAMSCVADYKLWEKAVKKRVESIQQRTKDLLSGGFSVEGFKLVEGRRPNKKWKDEDGVAQLAKQYGVVPYKKVTLSVTELAEQFTSKGLDKKELNKLIDFGEGKPVVAPESSNKRAIKMNVSEELFGESKE